MSAVACPDDTVTGIKITVIDDSTSDPIVNAQVETKKKYGTEMTKSVKRTGANGDAMFFPLTPGEYNHKVSITNYAIEEGSVEVTEGELTMITVRMTRL
jgi:hypothetical protein